LYEREKVGIILLENEITSILFGFGGASYMPERGTIRIKIFALISNQEK